MPRVQMLAMRPGEERWQFVAHGARYDSREEAESTAVYIRRNGGRVLFVDIPDSISPRKGRWHVTYDRTSPDGDEESGFLNAHGYAVSAQIGRETPGVGMTLREALRLCSPIEEDGCGTFTGEWGTVNLATGKEECRTIHAPKDITGASYRRAARIIMR